MFSNIASLFDLLCASYPLLSCSSDPFLNLRNSVKVFLIESKGSCSGDKSTLCACGACICGATSGDEIGRTDGLRNFVIAILSAVIFCFFGLNLPCFLAILFFSFDNKASSSAGNLFLPATIAPLIRLK